jgi:hypothetical protein
MNMAIWHLRCAWRHIKDAALEMVGTPREPTSLGPQ